MHHLPHSWPGRRLWQQWDRPPGWESGCLGWGHSKAWESLGEGDMAGRQHWGAVLKRQWGAVARRQRGAGQGPGPEASAWGSTGVGRGLPGAKAALGFCESTPPHPGPALTQCSPAWPSNHIRTLRLPNPPHHRDPHASKPSRAPLHPQVPTEGSGGVGDMPPRDRSLIGYLPAQCQPVGQPALASEWPLACVLKEPLFHERGGHDTHLLCQPAGQGQAQGRLPRASCARQPAGPRAVLGARPESRAPPALSLSTAARLRGAGRRWSCLCPQDGLRWHRPPRADLGQTLWPSYGDRLPWGCALSRLLSLLADRAGEQGWGTWLGVGAALCLRLGRW